MEQTGNGVIFSLMKGNIQHILTVMNSCELFLCDKAITKYSTYISRLYIALGDCLGRMNKSNTVYTWEKN